jgi:branched-chain amino acid transport system ATP-binding protein
MKDRSVRPTTPGPGESGQHEIEAAPPVFEVAGLSVHFGGVKAVDAVSFAVPRGSLFGVLGPNGSGKSTLLAAMSRLQRPTAGRINLDGKDITDLPPHRLARRGVGRTFQTPRLVNSISVRANVALAADRHRRTSPGTTESAGDRVQAAMERVGIVHVAHLLPEELSYGSRRRVEIARALAHRPSLLLLDEPVAGMNHRERDEVSDLLSDLRQDGLTQVLVEHDVAMMLAVCDIVMAMAQGHVLTIGPPHEVMADPSVREAYLGGRRA